MHIYLSSEEKEIIRFTSDAISTSKVAFTVVNSAEELEKQLRSPASPAQNVLMLDIDCSGTQQILEKLSSASLSDASLPLAVLAHTKHPIEGEPILPEHAIRIRKPFCIAALEHACIRAQRVRNGMPDEVLQAGDIVLYPSTGAAYRAGIPLRPHPREALLLEAFMRAPGEVLSRDYILKHFFDYTARPRPNLVDVLACRLRSRLHEGFETSVLRTVRGTGYMFQP